MTGHLKYSNNLYEETRYRKVIELLKEFCNPQDKIVVDLGAGNNPISDYISCKKVIKLDFIQINNPDVLCDLNRNIPLRDNVCDIVIGGEIFEHIYYSKNILTEIKRILKDRGYLLLTVPNVCCFFYRILWVLAKVPPLAATADFTHSPSGCGGGHVRDYNFKELENILRSLDFDILKSTTNGIIYGCFYIPPFLIPKTFGQKIIILARNKKQREAQKP